MARNKNKRRARQGPGASVNVFWAFPQKLENTSCHSRVPGQGSMERIIETRLRAGPARWGGRPDWKDPGGHWAAWRPTPGPPARPKPGSQALQPPPRKAARALTQPSHPFPPPLSARPEAAREGGGRGDDGPEVRSAKPSPAAAALEKPGPRVSTFVLTSGRARGRDQLPHGAGSPRVRPTFGSWTTADRRARRRLCDARAPGAREPGSPEARRAGSRAA